jgi:cytochrome c oxidase subunit II
MKSDNGAGMHVELYERFWMWAAAGLVVLFLGVIIVPAALQAIHPPSHIETVDPAALGEHPEFSNPKVSTTADGRIVAAVVASMFAFAPDPIVVPVNQPVTFRITSSDVVHGFQVVGTNANAMAIPGYVSQFTLTFPRTGEYLITCNEYCGLFHHAMVGKVVVQ